MGKLSDYVQFVKFRLSTLVVFSAFIGYVIGAGDNFSWIRLAWLVLGGFLVTGSSNGFNQLLEIESDKLMDRTANRPLPQKRMSAIEALILASAMGLAGISILTLKLNIMSGILGTAALLSYSAVYTPLKKITPLAVFVGAFPGAIPPLLGHVAATDGFGTIQFQALILFSVQFVWQFPHFWAIAWVVDDDYKKAGFNMLPSKGGRDKSSAFQILVYTLFLLPISLSPVLFRMSGSLSAIIIVASGVIFAWQAYRLYKELTIKAAQQLMFGSFIYLPVVQLAIMIGK